MQQNGQLNYGVVTSSPKSPSLNETILFPTTTRIQTGSILTEFDENPDLKHAVGQPKRWELYWGFSVKVQTATNTLITLFTGLPYGKRSLEMEGICSVLFFFSSVSVKVLPVTSLVSGIYVHRAFCAYFLRIERVVELRRFLWWTQ